MPTISPPPTLVLLRPVGETNQVLMGGGVSGTPAWQGHISLATPLFQPASGGTYFGAHQLVDGTADFVHFQRDHQTLWQLSSTGFLSHVLWDDAQNVVNPILIFGHRTTGTPQIGFGSSLRFNLQTSDSTQKMAAELQALWTNPVTSGRTSCLRFNVWDSNGLKTALALETDGTAAWSTLAGTPPATPTLARLLLGNPMVSGSSDGTWWGVNTGVGFAGDFWRCQLNGADRGVLTGAGTLTLAQALRAGGALFTRQTTVVPDGDLAAGELALWLDPTNGASKLKIKARSANGTVVTGEVALA